MLLHVTNLYIRHPGVPTLTAGDTDNVAELEEAFGELADRLADMFTMGRVVCSFT
jgi:hypothetical protein